MNANHVILALETSGKSGSVALLRSDGHQVECKTMFLPSDSGSAKTLAPTIEQLLSDQKVNTQSISAIGLLTGPGSFTGLRVGVATAKAIAYALKIPTIEIDTLDVIAMQCPTASSSAYVILDAYRGQVFCTEFKIHAVDANPRASRISQTEILDIEELLNRAKKCGNPNQLVDLCGPGCERIRRFLNSPNTSTIASQNAEPNEQTNRINDFASQIRWIDGKETEPNAQSVAKLASIKWLSGDVLDPFVLQPRYYRGSAAEELAAKSK